MIGIAPVVGTAVWWLSVRGVSNLGDEILLDQTSALHPFEVRSIPLLMRMIPATAWGHCRALYRS
jgi:hypothetical protein